MLNRKIPFYYILITFSLGLFISFIGFRYVGLSTELASDQSSEASVSSLCEINAKRMIGFKHIMPLIYAEPSCESQFLSSKKMDIVSLIDGYKTKGEITTASVYVRTFKEPQWFSINENEIYSPGSLLKVPELIAFYRMEELRPGTLKKSILYEKPFVTHRNINFDSKHIELGKSYTIRELLEYMIVYSDNDATMLLNQVIDRAVFNKVFSDVGLKEPDFNSRDYPMTAPDYAVFFKELFNGSYLSFENSESCMKLLSNSDFKDGMIAGIPSGVMAAHKFGEGGPDTEPNFCETALVYKEGRPYLLTVMTKGKDIKKLPGVIKVISEKVYNIMNAQG